MRRLLASLLLALLSLPLTPLLLPSDAEAQRPACCRRDGKHKCSMTAGQESNSASSDHTVKSLKTRCANFPLGHSTVASAPFLPAPLLAVAAPLTAALHPVTQTEALYRVSYNRTRQKRGPPSLFS